MLQLVFKQILRWHKGYKRFGPAHNQAATTAFQATVAKVVVCEVLTLPKENGTRGWHNSRKPVKVIQTCKRQKEHCSVLDMRTKSQKATAQAGQLLVPITSCNKSYSM